MDFNKKYLGEDNLLYAESLENISITLDKLGDLKGAKEGFLKVLAIKKI